MDSLSFNFDLTFIITLGIILIVGSAIFYYSYSRLNILEESIISQGKILQSFMTNQQNLINNSNKSTSNDDNTKSNTLPKIDVSDDEDNEEEDSEGENNESENSEDENSEDENSEDENSEDENSVGKNIKDKNIEGADKNIKNDYIELKNENDIVIDDIHSYMPTLIVSANTSANLNEKDILSNLLNLPSNISDTNNEIKIVDLEDTTINEELEENKEKKNKNLNKMNNQELKDLIIKKELASPEDISKLKKTELIEILQKNK